MALDATKWEVQVGKTIRYTGPDHAAENANYVTVLELHRWLQSLADDASVTPDDFLDVTTVNPSDKKFDTIITLTNGYTLDDAYTTPASEFIYGGSIIQGTGGTEVIYDGVRVVANRSVYVNVIQNGAVLVNDYWNAIPFGEGTVRGINFDAANGVAMQFMVKVKETGTGTIDNGALLFTTREWGKTYSEFRIPATGRGVNVVPLTYADDLNNTTASATVAGWTTIANVTEGFNLIDVDNNTVNEEYYSEWDRNTTVSYTINQFYERMKYLTRRASAESLYGLTGPLFRGITHSVTYTAQAGGAFDEAGAALTWGTGATAGTGQILADNDGGTTGTLYIQLLTGVIPTGTLTQGGVTATTGTVAEKTVSAPFCGASTGSSIVGAYGFALEYADLAVNDKLQALDGVTRQPPNNVTFTVGGVAADYRVLVGPEDGSQGLLYTQLSNTNLLNGGSVTTVQVDEALPANTPATAGTTGGIRIQRADGRYTLHRYTLITQTPTVFTIPTTDFTGAGNSVAIGANVFITYIDAAAAGATISYSTIQTASQTLFIEARFGGTGPNYTDSIKPAKTTGTLTSTGGSATVSTVSDA